MAVPSTSFKDVRQEFIRQVEDGDPKASECALARRHFQIIHLRSPEQARNYAEQKLLQQTARLHNLVETLLQHGGQTDDITSMLMSSMNIALEDSGFKITKKQVRTQPSELTSALFQKFCEQHQASDAMTALNLTLESISTVPEAAQAVVLTSLREEIAKTAVYAELFFKPLSKEDGTIECDLAVSLDNLLQKAGLELAKAELLKDKPADPSTKLLAKEVMGAFFNTRTMNFPKVDADFISYVTQNAKFLELATRGSEGGQIDVSNLTTDPSRVTDEVVLVSPYFYAACVEEKAADSNFISVQKLIKKLRQHQSMIHIVVGSKLNFPADCLKCIIDYYVKQAQENHLLVQIVDGQPAVKLQKDHLEKQLLELLMQHVVQVLNDSQKEDLVVRTAFEESFPQEIQSHLKGFVEGAASLVNGDYEQTIQVVTSYFQKLFQMYSNYPQLSTCVEVSEEEGEVPAATNVADREPPTTLEKLGKMGKTIAVNAAVAAVAAGPLAYLSTFVF